MFSLERLLHTVESLSRSLSQSPLAFGAQGISIAVIIHSFDRTLQTVLFKQALKEYCDNYIKRFGS